MFKVGAKMAQNLFFWPTEKQKNPRSKKFRHVGFMETFNI